MWFSDLIDALRCVYAHGHRVGAADSRYHHSKTAPLCYTYAKHYVSWITSRRAPSWMPTRLHRYVWRRGLYKGAKEGFGL